LRVDAGQAPDRGPLLESGIASIAVAIIVFIPLISAIIVANTISGNCSRYA
jgi:hypothetical protein